MYRVHKLRSRLTQWTWPLVSAPAKWETQEDHASTKVQSSVDSVLPQTTYSRPSHLHTKCYSTQLQLVRTGYQRYNVGRKCVIALLRNMFVASTMPRLRYEKLCQYLHCLELFVSGLVERRPASRRGFHDRCYPPTALHMLGGQWNVKLRTCRRRWRLVNGLFDNRIQQLREKFGWWAMMRDSGHTVTWHCDEQRQASRGHPGRETFAWMASWNCGGIAQHYANCASSRGVATGAMLLSACLRASVICLYWLPWIVCRFSCGRSVACSWTWCVGVLCETGPLGDKWTCWPGGTSGRCIIVLRDVVDSYLFRMHTFHVTSHCIIGPTGSSMNKHTYCSVVENEDACEKLAKVRPLITLCDRQFKACYTPKENVSDDEVMIRFDGLLGWKQYMPKKPVKWGMKIWSLCDSETG